MSKKEGSALASSKHVSFVRFRRHLTSSSCFLFFAPALFSQPQHFPLPPHAKISVANPARDKQNAESEVCKGFTLNREQVRARFRSYHQLTQDQLHDNYILAPCWVDGVIAVTGKTFTWRARPGNTLETSYPDGVSKMLGGKPSDSLSGK